MNVEGVILAAGLSSRTGIYKMTLEIEGKTIIERCVESMYDFCSRVIVVGGYRIEKLIPVLCRYHKVEIVYNKNYEQGMFSSVKEGFKSVREERFFYTPGDYPIIGKEVYEKMLKFDGDIIIPVYNGIKGHPLLMKSCIAKEFIYSDKYSNLREAVSSKETNLVDVNDPDILKDIDTMDDYKDLLNMQLQK
jgi:molybdenum cofactor cytidylyltransferase